MQKEELCGFRSPKVQNIRWGGCELVQLLLCVRCWPHPLLGWLFDQAPDAIKHHFMHAMPRHGHMGNLQQQTSYELALQPRVCFTEVTPVNRLSALLCFPNALPSMLPSFLTSIHSLGSLTSFWTRQLGLNSRKRLCSYHISLQILGLQLLIQL